MGSFLVPLEREGWMRKDPSNYLNDVENNANDEILYFKYNMSVLFTETAILCELSGKVM